MENQGFHGSIYTGEGSVNLREFQARQENPTNLDLCEDELFDEIFPRNPKQSDLEKEKGSVIRLQTCSRFGKIRPNMVILTQKSLSKNGHSEMFI